MEIKVLGVRLKGRPGHRHQLGHHGLEGEHLLSVGGWTVATGQGGPGEPDGWGMAELALSLLLSCPPDFLIRAPAGRSEGGRMGRWGANSMLTPALHHQVPSPPSTTDTSAGETRA